MEQDRGEDLQFDMTSSFALMVDHRDAAGGFNEPTRVCDSL
jgi:hypothetical protein